MVKHSNKSTPHPIVKKSTYESRPKPDIAQARRTSRKVALTGLAVAVIFTVLVASVGLITIKAIRKEAKDASDYNRVLEDIQHYPDAYKGADLPQYPKGQVTSLSRKDATLRDEISVVITAQADTETVTNYYDKELRGRGWTAESEEPVNDSFYFRDYTKGAQHYSLTVQAEGNAAETTITITWREDS